MNAETLELMLQTELPAAARGDRRAYGRIVVACQNTVTAIALAITRDVAASEDIAQEAFLKAWQQLNQLKNATSFLPWLRQITRNLARDHLRANRSRPMTGDNADLAIQMAADPSPTPSEHLSQTEEEVVANEIISSLPAESRETLLLYYREGQSSQQVATLLGLSDAAVRKRLSRARGTVREEMLKRFGEFARASAPGAAFAMVVLGGLVGAAPAASAATVIGSGLLGGSMGKLSGSGLAVGGLSGGIAGGSMGIVIETITRHPAVLWGAIGGMVAGMGSYALTWWYLACFSQSARQNLQIRQFMLLSAGSGAAWLFCLMLSTLLFQHWQPSVLICLAGMAMINYQYLVTLPRIMRPILADPVNAHRRRGYECLVGRKAVVLSTLLAIGMIAFAMVTRGLI